MFVVVETTGIAAWQMHSVLGISRELVCVNDGFAIDIPLRAAKNPRAQLVAMREHSESLVGRVLSVSEINLT